MKAELSAVLSSNSMKARAIRSTAMSVAGFGGAQFIRLVSNLVLTRLLYPEAFGLMALMFVFIIALEQFADLGTHTAIIQSERGDDPAFLNTGWTLQIIRGFILWLLACAITVPVSKFYEQDALRELMPVLALSTIVSGFRSTKLSTANRHLQLGRVTVIELTAQAFGTVVMVLAAWWLQSVWALVLGSILGPLLSTILSHRFLPGVNNRLFWDKSAFWEIFQFGKFLFFSTIAGYLLQQSDRLILGKFITLEDLAIYTIAFMFGSLSLTLNYQLNSRVILPLYRQRPPSESDSNYHQIGRARLMLIVGLLAIVALFAFAGVPLIEFLYDPRYHAAGPMLVLISLSLIPAVIVEGYKQLLLAHGDSKNFLYLTTILALAKVTLLIILVPKYGVVGAIVTPFVSDLLLYPLVVYFIRPYRGWHGGMDLLLILAGLFIMGLALWTNPTALSLLQTWCNM